MFGPGSLMFSMTLQYNTIQYNVMQHVSWDPLIPDGN